MSGYHFAVINILKIAVGKTSFCLSVCLFVSSPVHTYRDINTSAFRIRLPSTHIQRIRIEKGKIFESGEKKLRIQKYRRGLCQSVYLFVCLSVSLSIRLSVYATAWSSVGLSVCLFVFLVPFMWRSHVPKLKITFPSEVLALSDKIRYGNLAFHNVLA